MNNWRFSVKLVLLLVVLEGALRKWIIPQLSDYIYFLKDIVLLVAYFQYYLAKPPRRKFAGHRTLEGLLLLCVIICIAQAFNPNLGSPILGLFGARSYIIYMPLMYLTGDLFESVDELMKFLRSYLLLAVPVCLLGIVQFFSPASSPINAYAASANAENTVRDVAEFGDEGHARITGTFPYLVGLGTFTFTWILLGLGVWLNTSERKWKPLLLGILVLLQINVVMTGSRSPVYTLALAVAIFGVLSLNSRTNKERRSVMALIGIIVCLVGGISLVPSASDAFMQRASGAGDSVVDRFFGPYWQPFDLFGDAGIFGFGAGITQSGSNALSNAFNLAAPLKNPPIVEVESCRILMEIGIVGFVFWYAMRFCLLCLLWRTYANLKMPLLRQLCLLAFLVHAFTYGNQLVLNTTAGIYYWFLAGFIILLPRLEKNQSLENWHYMRERESMREMSNVLA